MKGRRQFVMLRAALGARETMQTYGAMVLLATLALGTGCGGRDEAHDPSDILGDWGSHRGVEGRSGEPGATAQPSARLATEAECRAAVQHLEVLALDSIVNEAQDPQERARRQQAKQAELTSDAFKQRVDEATRGCLDRETRHKEAQCILRVRREEDIERCPR